MPTHKAHVGLMIPLGAAAHDEPDGDEEDGEDGELPEHDAEQEAQDVIDAIEAKDARKLAHALELFVKAVE